MESVPIAITFSGAGTSARCEIETSSHVVWEPGHKMEMKTSTALPLGNGNKFQTFGFKNTGGNIVKPVRCFIAVDNVFCKSKGDKAHPLDSHPFDETVEVDKEGLSLLGDGRRIEFRSR